MASLTDEKTLKRYRSSGVAYRSEGRLKSNNAKVGRSNDREEIKSYRDFQNETIFPQRSSFKTLICAAFADLDLELYFFEHFNDRIVKMNMIGERSDTIAIDYHKRKDWAKACYQDQQNDKVYTLFERAGYSFLGEVDPNSGQILNEFGLDHRYVERIAVHNDVVYYLYRPFKSTQKKYLYKQRL